MRKYTLTDETMEFHGRTLHRIKALKDLKGVDDIIFVNKGDLGGWLESEDNLSQSNNAWVYGEAIVYDKAFVCDDARVYGCAEMKDEAYACGQTNIFNSAVVKDHAEIMNSAQVSGNARICERARISGEAWVKEDAGVYGESRIYGTARVSGEAMIGSSANVFGSAHISGNATIMSKDDYLVFKNNWSSGRYFTWTRSNDMWRVGCFYGTGKELIEKAYKDNRMNGDYYKTYVELVDKLKTLNQKHGWQH